MVPIANEVILCSLCSNLPSFHELDASYQPPEDSICSYSSTYQPKKRRSDEDNIHTSQSGIKSTKKARLSFFDRVKQTAREIPLKKKSTDKKSGSSNINLILGN